VENKTPPIKTWENDKPQTKYYHYWIQKRPNSRYTRGLTDQKTYCIVYEKRQHRESPSQSNKSHSNFNTKPEETKTTDAHLQQNYASHISTRLQACLLRSKENKLPV